MLATISAPQSPGDLCASAAKMVLPGCHCDRPFSMQVLLVQGTADTKLRSGLDWHMP